MKLFLKVTNMNLYLLWWITFHFIYILNTTSVKRLNYDAINHFWLSKLIDQILWCALIFRRTTRPKVCLISAKSCIYRLVLVLGRSFDCFCSFIRLSNLIINSEPLNILMVYLNGNRMWYAEEISRMLGKLK